MYCVRGRRRAVVTKVRPRLRLRQGVRGIGAPENDGVIRQQVADQDVRKRKDGYLALKPGCPPVCSGAGVWALSCSFVAPPANGCHRLPHRPGELSGRACAAVYSAARRSDGARSGYGRILSACEDQVRAAQATHATHTVEEQPHSPTGRSLASEEQYTARTAVRRGLTHTRQSTVG